MAYVYKDKTFTATLFAPTSVLESLDSRDKSLTWFSKHFPDALRLIREEKLLNDFEKNPRGSLISIKVLTSLPGYECPVS